jgi:hypothetical protein
MNRYNLQIRSALTIVALFAAFVSIVGCSGGRYPVNGKVTYPDGTPLTEGNVIGLMGEGQTSVTVQGTVKSDGTFSWGTQRPGDGALPGKYKVIVVPRGLGDSEIEQGMQPDVDSKFMNYDGSGITFEVKKGPNTLNITVTKPGKAK